MRVGSKRAGFPVAGSVVIRRGRARDLNSSQHSAETEMVCIILILHLLIVLMSVVDPILELLTRPLHSPCHELQVLICRDLRARGGYF